MAVEDEDKTIDARATDIAVDATVDATRGSLSDVEPGRSGRLSLRDYEMREVLGRGGMGEVVLGRDKNIGRDVAIKQLRVERPSDEAVSRFLREAKIQARLEHPSIVPVHHIGHDERGRPYFTMKRLTGTTLADQLAAEASPPRQRMLRTFADVCVAVEFAHARSVVHRDLKPSNIMVGEYGEVYVLDWGLARMVGERAETRSMGDDVVSLDGETKAGSMLGTPGYMAPEQMQDASAAGPAADVYALGAILFEILTGKPLHPRGQGAIASTLKGIDGGPRVHPAGRDVPPELDELCTRALASQPEDRPSAKMLAEGLQGYLDGDRDLAKRRELAATHVQRAVRAMASGDINLRAEAMREAGHALVLDPESRDAATIVQTVMFEPATEYPAELRVELAESELAVQQRQGKAAMLSFAVVLAYLLFAATNGVLDVPLIVGIAIYTLVHASVVWRITQRLATAQTMLIVAVGNAMLAALISRTFGSMIIVPAVTCVMALSLTAYPLLIDRRWVVIGLLVASWIIPVVLEQAGVLASTWALHGDQIELGSHTLQLGGAHTVGILIGSNIVTIVVLGLFSSALATSRRHATRQAIVQAWKLRRLLPSQR